MKCQNCKNQIQSGERFCKYCGKQIKKKKTVLWIGGGILFFVMLVLVVFVGYFFWNKKKSQDLQNAIALYEKSQEEKEEEKKEEREKDIQNAGKIQKAVKKALKKKLVRSDMVSYEGTLLYLDEDLAYLPKSFRKAFAGELDEIPTICYAEDGAAGFSCFIDSDTGEVQVYIASSNRLDEWEILPELSERYETGEMEESESEGIQNLDYRYAKLVSKDSPIMGYWQSDGAGMYIGWNTSPDKEGFSLYVYEGGVVNTVVNQLESYSWTGGLGEIYFVSEYENVSLSVLDSEHVTLFMQTSEESSKYTFTRSEVDDSLAEQLCGEWIGDFQSQSVSYEVSYENGYHYKKYVDGELCDQSSERKDTECGATIVMSDGKSSVEFFSPEKTRGRSYESMLYDVDAFTVDSDNPDRLCYTVLGIEGGCYDWYVFRAGSESAKAQKAIYEYQKYLDKKKIEIGTCDLIYLDDDEIPELVYNYEYCADEELLYYSDGTVKDHEEQNLEEQNYWGKGGFSYREKTGEFCLSGVNGSFVHSDYYKYENNTVTHVGSSVHSYTGGKEEYHIGDDYNLVSKKVYKKYESSFGEYDGELKRKYTSLYDAACAYTYQ